MLEKEEEESMFVLLQSFSDELLNDDVALFSGGEGVHLRVRNFTLLRRRPAAASVWISRTWL